ncbi:MAG: hypothetical protein GF416_08570 [Candidatus Altiarchaeales archaeon]|nr:hypothetical protein [Candidatus Altiarchaeales archaeon]MBD3417169.1 hypothetical protein [Candidatus Altiarchaeales archaeon]
MMASTKYSRKGERFILINRRKEGEPVSAVELREVRVDSEGGLVRSIGARNLVESVHVEGEPEIVGRDIKGADINPLVLGERLASDEAPRVVRVPRSGGLEVYRIGELDLTSMLERDRALDHGEERLRQGLLYHLDEHRRHMGDTPPRQDSYLRVQEALKPGSREVILGRLSGLTVWDSALLVEVLNENPGLRRTGGRSLLSDMRSLLRFNIAGREELAGLQSGSLQGSTPGEGGEVSTPVHRFQLSQQELEERFNRVRGVKRPTGESESWWRNATTLERRKAYSQSWQVNPGRRGDMVRAMGEILNHYRFTGQVVDHSREEHQEDIIALIDHPSSTIRQCAAISAGSLGLSSAVDSLIGRIDDPDEEDEVVFHSIRAVGRIGLSRREPMQERDVRAVPHLMRFIQMDQPRNIREAAVDALTSIGGDAAYEILDHRMRSTIDPETDPFIREIMTEGCIEHLDRVLDRDSATPEDRIDAVRRLTKIGMSSEGGRMPYSERVYLLLKHYLPPAETEHIRDETGHRRVIPRTRLTDAAYGEFRVPAKPLPTEVQDAIREACRKLAAV